MVASHYNRYYSLETRESLLTWGSKGCLLEISDAAEQIGFQTLAVQTSYEKLLDQIPLPCVAHWEEDHFVVVYKANKDTVWVADPAEGKYKLSKAEFLSGWTNTLYEEEEEEGILLLLEPTPAFYERDGEQGDRSKWSYVGSYFRQYNSLLIQLGIGVLIAGILQISFPFLLKSLVDIGIGYVEPGFITIMVGGLAILLLAQTIVEIFRRWILIHVAVRVNVNILSDFLRKLTKLPLRYFDNRLTGDLLMRIGDHERIQRFLTSTALVSLLSLFNFVAFSLLLLFWNKAVLFVFFIGTLFNLAWVYAFQRMQRDEDYKSFDLEAQNQGKLIEMVDGMQDIKLHNAETPKRWAWERAHAAQIRTALKAATWHQVQRTGGEIINEGKNLLILFMVATAVLEGTMTIGMLVAIMYVVAQLNSPIRSFVEFIQSFQEAQISLERMNEIHAKEGEDGADKINMLPETGDIILDQVYFQYNGPSSPTVLKNINLTINKGETTVIVGSSGSGKSTLLKLMLNMYAPVDGSVRLGDVKMENLQLKFWRERCGVVLQDGYIFNDTIARNIALGDEVIDKKRLLKAVKIANIQSFIEGLALGYNTKIGKDGLGLSAGEKQRMLIARAIYKEPDYFFFDEATSALDSYSEMLIMERIAEYFPDKTIVIVAHRLNTVRLADRVVVMEAGEIVEEGTHDALYYHRGAYYQLVKNQIELGA
ncbi:MAG: peptidase domain-containing ABC transporter [Saprospiraceae bacterium]